MLRIERRAKTPVEESIGCGPGSTQHGEKEENVEKKGTNERMDAVAAGQQPFYPHSRPTNPS